MIHLDPYISSHQIGRKTSISQSTVKRILNTRRYHAYHITLTQQLIPNDMVLCGRFYRWALQMIWQDHHFFRYVLFSDESTFKNIEELNRHNCHYWSNVNPHWFRSVDNQNRWSLMVWCGIVNDYLIGPYSFFEENVNRVNFLELLRDILPELLEQSEECGSN